MAGSQTGKVLPFGDATKASPTGLIFHDFTEFLAHEYPPRENILAPWLPTRGLAMIAGQTGLGKTMLGSAVAYAIATGGSLLGWKVEKPRKVLYVDGEMDPAELRERFLAFDQAARRDKNGNPDLLKDNLYILCDGEQPLGIPGLGGKDNRGRRLIEDAVRATGAEVLELDNLSVLAGNSEEAESDEASWRVMQDWLVQFRRKGKSVILQHHTTKPDNSGKTRQRGTSKHEDVLNSSILLSSLTAKDRTCQDKRDGFKLGFTKHRGFTAPEPFTVFIDWDKRKEELRLVLQDLTALVVMMREEGDTQDEIAEKLGLSQSTVCRMLAAVKGRR